MKNCHIEEMDEESVVSTRDSIARTPFEAAQQALGHRITLRGDARKWIRVTDLVVTQPTRRRPRCFEFRKVGKAQMQRPNVGGMDLVASLPSQHQGRSTLATW